MDRQYYLDLAASGLRMPVGAHLVLHEKEDPEAITLDGERLGAVVAEAARRFRTPIAASLMDLMLEKAALLQTLGVGWDQSATFHFKSCPDDAAMQKAAEGLEGSLPQRMQAQVDAVRYVAENTDLLPVGMTIGPFSLMTKLLADPITPVFLAGSGISADDDEEVRTVDRCLALALLTIKRSLSAQIEAGAKLVFVAEPAANSVYISPKQLDAGSDIFERYVMDYNRPIKRMMDDSGVDLLFHCCGELTDYMVRCFASLDPAILSLGSSRNLWEDAALVPKTTVLYGNLPTKRFFSDEVTCGDVQEMACELLSRMKQVGHPFILGSECDVLSVPGSEQAIKSKVETFMTCACH